MRKSPSKSLICVGSLPAFLFSPMYRQLSGSAAAAVEVVAAPAAVVGDVAAAAAVVALVLAICPPAAVAGGNTSAGRYATSGGRGSTLPRSTGGLPSGSRTARTLPRNYRPTAVNRSAIRPYSSYTLPSNSHHGEGGTNKGSMAGRPTAIQAAKAVMARDEYLAIPTTASIGQSRGDGRSWEGGARQFRQRHGLAGRGRVKAKTLTSPRPRQPSSLRWDGQKPGWSRGLPFP